MYLNQHRLDIWVKTFTGIAYTGPGDVVANAEVWWGLRAYSKASIGNNVVKLRRSSDNTTQDFVSLGSGALDVASIATFKGAGQVFVDTLYDQTGNGFDLVQATAVNQPELLLNNIGALPSINFVGASSQSIESVGNFAHAQPVSVSLVANSTNTAAQQSVSGNLSAVFVLYQNAGPNDVALYAGAVLNATATDGATHAIQGVYSGASSNIVVDGVTTTGDVSTGALNTRWIMGTFGAQFFTGTVNEVGWWLGTFTPTQETNLNANQHTYWGF